MKRSAGLSTIALSLVLLQAVPCSAAPIKIRYAYWLRQPWVEAVVKGFNKSQSKYEVVYEQPGDWVSYIITSIAAGSPPTVFSGWSGHGMLAWMKRGLLLDLNPYIAREKDLDIGDIPRLLRAGGQYEGHTYGFPYESVGAYCVTYNYSLMKPAGLPKPAEGWTVQDFMDYATKLTKDKNGDGKTDTWGMNYLYYWWESRISAQVLGGGGLYWTNDHKEWVGDSPANVKALELLADLTLRRKVTEPPYGYIDAGKHALWVRDAWATTFIAKAKAKYEFGVAPPPTIDGTRYHPQETSGTFLCIPSNTRKREVEGAWAFIKYWTGEAGMKSAWSATGGLERPPARRSLAHYFVTPADKALASIDRSAFIKYESTAVTSENWPMESFDRIDAVIQAGWASVMEGKVSVRQFIDTVSPKVRQLAKGRAK